MFIAKVERSRDIGLMPKYCHHKEIFRDNKFKQVKINFKLIYTEYWTMYEIEEKRPPECGFHR